MNQKLPALALAVTLTGALSIGALAGEPERLISPKPTACAGAITVNGQALDTAGVPAVSGQGLLPMRLVAESDHGSAAWYEEENTGAFYLDGNVISVDFATGSVTVNDTAAEGVTARVVQGVTFLPAALLEGLEGYTVEAAEDGLAITTPHNAPLVKLAYQIMDASGMGYGMKTDAQGMAETYGLPADAFEQAVGFFPMMVSPDTLVLGKLAEGADTQAVKTALETYRQGQEDTFSWYLSQNLPKVQDARLLVQDGYVLFLIAENADAGEAAFTAALAALD